MYPLGQETQESVVATTGEESLRVGYRPGGPQVEPVRATIIGPRVPEWNPWIIGIGIFLIGMLFFRKSK